MDKAIFFESVAGVAGDMFAAAFVDAGLVTVGELDGLSERLGLSGVTLSAEPVIRATIKATHIKVNWPSDDPTPNDHHHHHHHGHDHHHDPHRHSHTHEDPHLDLANANGHHSHTHFRDIAEMIERSSLELDAKTLALKIFHLLAEAEADAHGIGIENVAFHEVGTIDSIMDVVMAAYCVTKTGVRQVFATPIKPGRGTIEIQHGTHPIPPPASIRLLTGMPVTKTPEAIIQADIELSTPTGIAILKALSPQFVGEMPPGIVLRQGMGAGTMDFGSYPNVFRISLIETSQPEHDLPYEQDRVVEIVCNIDDDTGEHMAWLTESLFEQGALDVWQTPATGKKGRVLVCLSVLVEEGRWAQVADWILRSSTTFGIRHRFWDRLKLVRKYDDRVEFGRSIRYKAGFTTSGEKLKEKPEHDDLAAAKFRTI